MSGHIPVREIAYKSAYTQDGVYHDEAGRNIRLGIVAVDPRCPQPWWPLQSSRAEAVSACKSCRRCPSNKFLSNFFFFSLSSLDCFVFQHTTSSKAFRYPFQCFTSSVASCFFHSSLSAPKYPVNAFSPHGHALGFDTGENALTLLYLPGFFKNSVKAP